MQKYIKKHKALIAFVFWLIFGLLVFFGLQNQESYRLSNWSSQKIEKLDFSRFDEILSTLKTTYYDQEKIQTWLMLENAVKAYVDALDDPYTSYMDPEMNSWFQEELKWENDFEWIWAVISKKDYYILVEEVLKDSPAFKAWILPLDRIVIINSWITKDITVQDAMKNIRGPKGTIVKLSIERIKNDENKNETRELIEKDIIRDKLSLPSVTSQILTGKDNINIWYIAISIIWEETENLFKLAIEKIINNKDNQKIKWIILDLRGNGWWFLPIAVEISSHFIPLNELIVSAKYKQLWEESYYSKWYKNLENIATVVLVDQMTASAWEIIAMALQEQIWAKIVWTQTFWKWSIQTIEDYNDWASLKYTIGKRYSPNNKNIDKIWIKPDITIEFDIEAYKNSQTDNQLGKARTVLFDMIQ